MARTAASETTITIHKIKRKTQTFNVVGLRPLICNRMSEKAKGQLLWPSGRMTAADKQSNVKHDPLTEFRASPYTFPSEEAPTLLALMSSAFKGAMMTAALEMPGAKKAQIGRLVYVEGDYSAIYGVPKLLMSVTRSADINRTPDIRTRAIVPLWAARVEITWVEPTLTAETIANLLDAGGTVSGVGDWRPEKGKGNYGQFQVVSDDDAEFREIVAEGGRVAQVAAMAAAEPYDAETAEMLDFWHARAKATGRGSNGKVAVL
jgi:hypothetical protein